MRTYLQTAYDEGRFWVFPYSEDTGRKAQSVYDYDMVGLKWDPRGLIRLSDHAAWWTTTELGQSLRHEAMHISTDVENSEPQAKAAESMCW